MKRRCVIDDAIGETRAAVWEGKVLAELYTRRWTDEARPRIGDRFAGRVTRIEKSLAAAFIDLGGKIDGFLKFTTAPNAPRLTEGSRIEVEIIREAEGDKGPVVKFISASEETVPGRTSGKDLRTFIAERFPAIKFEDAKVGTLLDAVQTDILVPGGGSISIERTRALTAIDIDSGNAVSPFSVAKAACPLIAHQLRLRGIGGLIVIDFPNLRQRKQREDIISELENSFKEDPNILKFSGLSRFGVVEMTRSRIGPSLDEILLDRSGQESVETQALEALRRLEQEGRAHPGAKLTLQVPTKVYDWLQSGIIEWKKPLSDRLGARYTLECADRLFVLADR